LYRQIRTEASLLFFSNTNFGFETSCKMNAFARSLSQEQREAIRSIKLLRHELVMCHDLCVFTSLETICVSSIYKIDDGVTQLVRRRADKAILKLEFDHGK
jgi:hypothetical protein